MLCVYPHPNFWILHIDGSAKPNPGRMAIGAVLTGPGGEHFALAQKLPGTGCNNEAELRALQAGLQLAQVHAAQHVRIYTDSQWLREQLDPSCTRASGLRSTQRLAPCLAQVRQRLEALAWVQWRWVPRHCNTEADALARQGLLDALKS